MNKKLFFLMLALLALVGGLGATPQVDAVGGTCQPICTYYPDGSKCCVSCFGTWPHCGCTDVYCPPAGGIN